MLGGAGGPGGGELEGADVSGGAAASVLEEGGTAASTGIGEGAPDTQGGAVASELDGDDASDTFGGEGVAGGSEVSKQGGATIIFDDTFGAAQLEKMTLA